MYLTCGLDMPIWILVFTQDSSVSIMYLHSKRVRDLVEMMSYIAPSTVPVFTLHSNIRR